EIIEETFRFAEVAVSARSQSALLAGLPESSASGAMQSGDFRKAAALYQPIAAARPQDARIRLAYGNALLGAGMYKDARAQFDQAKNIGGLGARDLGIPAAKACALDHDPDCAIVWLKTIPPQFLPESTEYDPDFTTLHDRPDFRALFGHP